MITIAILGLGARGATTYGDYCYQNNLAHITAICDTDAEKIKFYKERYNIDSENCFFDDNEFFKEKRADAIIIATMDDSHYRQTMLALQLGYHILLEKPIALKAEHCMEIEKEAIKLKRKVVVAHVLRYTTFYSLIKNIVDNGLIGEVIHIQQAENVGYYHQAHSFVRGNWRNSKESSPMILQKCCHDFDIIQWIAGAKCLEVSSYGSLDYFKKENAPDGATKRCLDNCPHFKTCIYNAVDHYINKQMYRQYFPGYSDEQVKDVLKTHRLGRCVYYCDNDVVDHQIVNLKFENNITASLTMCAFSKDSYRETKVMGTKGEIIADDLCNKVRLRIFGAQDKEYDIKQLSQDLSGHGGGDNKMLKDFIEDIKNNSDNANTNISKSVESHLMAFAAEESRTTGRSITIHRP